MALSKKNTLTICTQGKITQYELLAERVLTQHAQKVQAGLEQIRQGIRNKLAQGATIEPGMLAVPECLSDEVRS